MRSKGGYNWPIIMVSLRRCLPLATERRDSGNQWLQTCTLDRDRPEVSYLQVDSG